MCTLSAVVPVVSTEAYLLAQLALLPARARVGHRLHRRRRADDGKLLWYAAGWESLDSARVQHRLDVGRRRERCER
ncbi:hypothetical protein ACI3ET_01145 [Ornithinimicrobium sp. LYQ121]|uniref:hypothetical protein n=1 Tax=Ornithinimicrobium sp. LYQ121 TaxID=3378801 RepID=UPI003854D25E